MSLHCVVEGKAPRAHQTSKRVGVTTVQDRIPNFVPRPNVTLVIIKCDDNDTSIPPTSSVKA